MTCEPTEWWPSSSDSSESCGVRTERLRFRRMRFSWSLACGSRSAAVAAAAPATGGRPCSTVTESESRKSSSSMNISSSCEPPGSWKPADFRRYLSGSGRITRSLPIVPSCYEQKKMHSLVLLHLPVDLRPWI